MNYFNRASTLFLLLLVLCLLTYCKFPQDSNSNEGQVIFWKLKSAQLGNITIKLNNVDSGIINNDFDKFPGCSSINGIFKIKLPIGIYNYKAYEEDRNKDGLPDHFWEGNISIIPDSCENVGFYL